MGRTEPYIFLACVLLPLLLGACLPYRPLPASAPTAEPRISAPSVTALEAEVHERINAHRQRQGLAPLRLEAALISLAREHSEQMARGRRPFGHDGFDERFASARATLPIRSLAENVALNDFPVAQAAAEAVRTWLQSPGHRRNLKGDYNLTGVGVARSRSGAYFFTQLYAAGKP